MKRTVKKQFWLSRDEAQELQKKAKRTCLSEAALFRLLVRDFEPKENLPDVLPELRSNKPRTQKRR